MSTSGLIDCHLHLQDYCPDTDVSALIEEARAVGVTHFVCNGEDERDWPKVLRLASERPDVIPCFGLHPWMIEDRSRDWLSALESYLLRTPSGVGETGLDHLHKPSHPAQEEVFVAQLRLARELDRPAMVHCLQAWGWLLEVLEREGPSPPLLIHAYGGAAEMIPPLAARGAFFSFGGGVLHERKLRARAALRAVPLDRLLVETDAPALLPPKPYRPHVLVAEGGEVCNEPANLPAIVEGIAQLRGVPADELREITWSNARRLLGPLLPTGSVT